jgi:tetratricopeptide (TPR) repeat protein
MKRTVVSTVAVVLASLSLGACMTPPGVQGRGFYNAGNYLFAADAFTEDIREHPRSAIAWNNRAVTRVRLGDLNGAIRDYNRAIELSPDDPEIYFNRANALVSAGLYDEAIVDYDRAIQLNPFYARAIFNRGSAYALAGKPDPARHDWQAAIGLEADPYAKSAMRRSTGLEAATASVASTFTSPPAAQPTTAYTIAPPPPPGTAPGAVPLPTMPSAVAQAPSSQPAASPQAFDSRALTTRAISRELDGDHAGAVQDLNAALAIEPDTARREAIARMLRLLDTPR